MLGAELSNRHLSNNATGHDLWLGLSGYCYKLGAANLTCAVVPLATFYGQAYNETSIGSLAAILPSDFGTQATLLLAAMILFGMTIVFMCWGAIDLKKAEMYEQRRRRKWVQEWLQSRRLDLTAAAFAVGAIACGYTASSHIASTAAASDAALNILGAQLSDAPFNKSETGSATNILAAAWLCAAAAVVLLLLTLSWDGLSRKLRCSVNVELLITG